MLTPKPSASYPPHPPAVPRSSVRHGFHRCPCRQSGHHGRRTPADRAAPLATGPAATAPPAGAPVGAGSPAAGKVVFSNTCAGCHAGLGTRAGFGPQLAAQGLTAVVITTTVENGKGQMPAGLASGQDLADVVAYVESLQ